ncbi:hypothetical protein PROFUN_11383 [Planoprotostelium fungivorum]|uniref:tRNA(His) guanylyltransferase n=1 Tax=Planoprotostelium fungivorum TaxID=1890364 RepID=A0A2P6N331_9EUKA|nr:hypothetical protein PROFUN_11383 [Planoprotostelium fungivorum]
MAGSRYEYVKNFERDEVLLHNCWVVVRVDGRAFHQFVDEHDFIKPNDKRGLDLMNECALEVCKNFSDCVVFAYGESDEYSFVLSRDTKLFNRRQAKIITSFSSLFASNYVFLWSRFFPDKALKRPPAFDARAVCYPTTENLRDYLSWRQADCHINNLYNLCYWKLVESGKSRTEAEKLLSTTLSQDKNELLFKQFGINYAHEPEMFRKGSIICKVWADETKKDEKTGQEKTRKKRRLRVVYCDIIGDKFWKENPEILNEESGKKNKGKNTQAKTDIKT